MNKNSKSENELTDIGSPIKNFINQTIKQVNDGTPKGYALTSNIDFDLSIVNQKTGKGKVDVKVLGFGRDVSNQSIQRVKFSIGDPKIVTQQMKNLLDMVKEFSKEMEKQPKKKRRK